MRSYIKMSIELKWMFLLFCKPSNVDKRMLWWTGETNILLNDASSSINSVRYYQRTHVWEDLSSKHMNSHVIQTLKSSVFLSFFLSLSFCFVKSSKSFLSCLFLKPYRVYKVSQNVVTSINYAVPVCITQDLCMRAHWASIPVMAWSKEWWLSCPGRYGLELNNHCTFGTHLQIDRIIRFILVLSLETLQITFIKKQIPLAGAPSQHANEVRRLFLPTIQCVKHFKMAPAKRGSLLWGTVFIFRLKMTVVYRTTTAEL